VPVAVVELNPRRPDLDGPGAEVKVNMEVAVKQLDAEIILKNRWIYFKIRYEEKG
jgi:hypothetical protein